MRNLLITSLLSWLLMGCATSFQFELASPTAELPRLSVVDKRGEVERSAAILGRGAAQGCGYGMYRIGDDQTVPHRNVALAIALSRMSGTRLNGKQVVVTQFEIYDNSQSVLVSSRLRAPYPGVKQGNDPSTVTGTPPGLPSPSSGREVAAQAVGGAVAFTLIAAIENAASKQPCDLDAKVLSAENPGNWPAMIVHLKLEVDGAAAEASVIEFEPYGLADRSRLDIKEARLKRAVTRAIEQAGTELLSKLPD